MIRLPFSSHRHPPSGCLPGVLSNVSLGVPREERTGLELIHESTAQMPSISTGLELIHESTAQMPSISIAIP